jgi:uncharacterized DUF497 family protein
MDRPHHPSLAATPKNTRCPCAPGAANEGLVESREVKEKHGVSLGEAREIFDQAYLVDQKNDDPEQFRTIGWCRDRLCSAIFDDSDGEYYRLITAWKATKQEEESYAENI